VQRQRQSENAGECPEKITQQALNNVQDTLHDSNDHDPSFRGSLLPPPRTWGSAILPFTYSPNTTVAKGNKGASSRPARSMSSVFITTDLSIISNHLGPRQRNLPETSGYLQRELRLTIHRRCPM